nr:putative ribonuclease H-like domain-containing protein [Tanacetum cinerariifolium]
MDLKWQMAMLTMRARKFLQKTSKNLGVNGPTSMGFNIAKVECYNCHKKGHFARECRSPKDTRRPAVTEPQRRSVPIETSTSNALVSQCDAIGLEYVEARLLVYKKNESVLKENIKLLNYEVQLRDTALATLRQKLETIEKDRDALNLNDNDSWSPSNLYDRFVSSGGYHAVPPPMTGTFMPPKPDLVFHTPPSDKNEHLAFNVQLSPSKPEQDLPTISSAPIIEDWVSDSEEEDLPQVTNDVPSLAQSHELVKTPRHSGLISPPPMSVAPHVPLRPHSPSKGLKRPKKTYFVCKSETHLIKDCDFHANKLTQKSYASRDTHKHHAQMHHSRIPLHTITTAARTIGAARPTFLKTHPYIAPYDVSKSKAPIRRPLIRHTSPKPRISPLRVNAAKLSTVSAARINAVQPSAVTVVQHNHTKKGNPQQALKDKGVIDSGCSRHMTGNMSYLSDFEELNGGYGAFSGNPKGGLENLLSLTVKIIRCDNGTEFKNADLNQFCGFTGIKREFSVPRTPQQNVIAERKNRTLIEAARTLLADSLLPIPF